MVANPEIIFYVFFGSGYCQQPLFFSTRNSLPSCWYSRVPGIFSPLFLCLGGSRPVARIYQQGGIKPEGGKHF